MTKETRTALELADLIRYQVVERDLRVAVFVKGQGWFAKVYAETKVEQKLQRRVDAAVAMLSEQYDLY